MRKLIFSMIVFAVFLVCPNSYVNAQGVGINSSGNPPHSSAVLDASSHSQGMLIPRMSESERNVIANPALGLMIFNTTTNCLNMWLGNGWKQSCFECDFTAPLAGNNGPVCAGATLNLSATTIPGGTYQWAGPNGFTSTQQNPGILNATTSASGAYSVIATKNGCSAAQQSTVAIVNATPATPTAGNDGPKCVGQSLSLTATTVSGAAYSWTGPNGYTSTVQNPIISNAQLSDAGTYSVTVAVSGCISAGESTGVTINTSPGMPGSITGSSSVCPNSTGNVYSISSVSAATSYNWAVPPGASITSNTGTSITVTFGSVPTGNITVSATNTCGTSAQSTLAISQGSICSPLTFNYTGSQQTFTIPPGITSLTVDAYGAEGHLGSSIAGPSTGGKGGRVTATVTVTPGETIYIYVGGAGALQTGGGFNGGGNGGWYSPSYIAGKGGGASDIRRGGNTLNDRIVVAGGGGGAGAGGCAPLSGGAGGATTGGTGITCDSSPGGFGGTQTGGGLGVGGGTNGSWGTGGDSYTSTSGGGGGGGYYGGGGSQWAGGGGGSSFATGSNIQHYQGTNSGNGKIIVAW